MKKINLNENVYIMKQTTKTTKNLFIDCFIISTTELKEQFNNKTFSIVESLSLNETHIYNTKYYKIEFKKIY